MRNLTFAEWAWTTIALLLVLNVSTVFQLATLSYLIAAAFLVLSIERFINVRRLQRRTCGLYQVSHSGARSHPCTLPADGHTTHRCSFNDCSWGY